MKPKYFLMSFLFCCCISFSQSKLEKLKQIALSDNLYSSMSRDLRTSIEYKFKDVGNGNYDLIVKYYSVGYVLRINYDYERLTQERQLIFNLSDFDNLNNLFKLDKYGTIKAPFEPYSNYNIVFVYFNIDYSDGTRILFQNKDKYIYHKVFRFDKNSEMMVMYNNNTNDFTESTDIDDMDNFRNYFLWSTNN